MASTSLVKPYSVRPSALGEQLAELALADLGGDGAAGAAGAAVDVRRRAAVVGGAAAAAAVVGAAAAAGAGSSSPRGRSRRRRQRQPGHGERDGVRCLVFMGGSWCRSVDDQRAGHRGVDLAEEVVRPGCGRCGERHRRALRRPRPCRRRRHVAVKVCAVRRRRWSPVRRHPPSAVRDPANEKSAISIAAARSGRRPAGWRRDGRRAGAVRVRRRQGEQGAGDGGADQRTRRASG